MTRRRRLACIALLALLGAFPGCAGRGKNAETAPQRQTADALFERAMDLLSRRQLRQARAVLERIQYTPERRQELEPLVRLALADATFYKANSLALIDARSLYSDFGTLYLDHPRAPYAQLQAGVCSLKQTNAPSKDQTLTLRAIRELQEVEIKYPDSVYARAARGMIRKARAKLAESEYLVGKFYLKRKGYVAATQRFRVAADLYPEFAERDKVLFHLGKALVLSNNGAEGRIYLDKVVQDFPAGQYTEDARQLLDTVGGELRMEFGGDSQKSP